MAAAVLDLRQSEWVCKLPMSGPATITLTGEDLAELGDLDLWVQPHRLEKADRSQATMTWVRSAAGDDIVFSVADVAVLDGSGRLVLAAGDTPLAAGPVSRSLTGTADRRQSVSLRVGQQSVDISLSISVLGGVEGDYATVAELQAVVAAMGPRNAASGYPGLDADGLIADSQVPASMARDSEVTNRIATHNGSPAAHDDRFAAKADLVGGVVPTSQIPALATVEVYPVESEEEMLALECQRGDIAIRSDVMTAFILADDDPSVLADWLVLPSPVAPVTLVNGQAGIVVLGYADVGAAAAAHGHAAGDVTSGTFSTARIPTLAQSKVSDLEADLAAKAPMSTGIVVVNAGSNLSTSRPSGYAAVFWQFSSGVDVGDEGENIVNAVAGDIWTVAS